MRKWYRKKRYWIASLVLVLGVILLYNLVLVSDIPYTLPNVNDKNLGNLEIQADTLHDHLGNPLAIIDTGQFVVKENRGDANSNRIGIYFERFRSTAANPLPPIFFLAGGPGSSATGIGKTEYFFLFRELSKYADVVLMDQRGVGGSIPNLSCRNSLSLPVEVTENIERQLLDDLVEKCKECREEFEEMGIRLPSYNSYETALDIDELREALGYENIVLYGYSYGSELAQIYLKDFEDKVSKLILAAPLAPDHGLKLPFDLQYQYEVMDSLIRKDKRLSKYIPDFMELVRGVHKELKIEPKLAQVPVQDAFSDDASTAEKRWADVVAGFKPHFNLILTDVHLQMMVADRIGQDRTTRRLPKFYYQLSQGNYREAGNNLRNFSRRRLPNALFFTVNGANGYDDNRLQRVLEQEKRALFSHFSISYGRLPEVFTAFGVTQIPGMNVPVFSEKETLFIGGTLDGRTPPRITDEIALRFPNNKRILIENAGHNDLLNNEVMEALINFIDVDTLPEITTIHKSIDFAPPIPYTYSIQDTVINAIVSEGVGKGIDLYNELHKTYSRANDYIFDFSIEPIEDIADYFMEESAYEVVITFLESMRPSFPNNSTVFSMLGEAYYRNGDRKQALSNLNRAISLDFFNGNAQALYAKLIREQSEL